MAQFRLQTYFLTSKTVQGDNTISSIQHDFFLDTNHTSTEHKKANYLDLELWQMSLVLASLRSRKLDQEPLWQVSYLWQLLHWKALVADVVAADEVVADGLLEGEVRPLELVPRGLVPRVIDAAAVEVAYLLSGAKDPQAEQGIAATWQTRCHFRLCHHYDRDESPNQMILKSI